MAASLTVSTLAERPEFRKAAAVIEKAAWSGLEYLNYTRSHYAYFEQVQEEYPDYQLVLVDDQSGYPVAAANCVPIYCEDPDALPSEGWDWVVETAARSKGGPKNTAVALAASVPALHRGKGYARIMINAMLDLARRNGLERLIAPVRPTAKSAYPEVPIEDYITWTDERGRMFDPWLRNHVSAGARVVAPCKRSMVVEEPIAFWETWTQQRFEASGTYMLKGALAPVKMDVNARVGLYEEPNVWVSYAA